MSPESPGQGRDLEKTSSIPEDPSASPESKVENEESTQPKAPADQSEQQAQAEPAAAGQGSSSSRGDEDPGEKEADPSAPVTAETGAAETGPSKTEPSVDSPASAAAEAASDSESEGTGDEEDLQQEMDQFEALIDQHLPGKREEAPRGKIIDVQVVDVRDETVLVDIGGKAEATLRLDEFPVVDGKPDVHVGQTIKVAWLGDDAEGHPRASHREARTREAEDRIRKALETNEPVKGLVTQTVKGGLMVDVGLPAFMPASQVDLFKIPDLNSLLGKEVEAYVIEFDQRRKRAVLSRRRLLYERRENERRSFLESLDAGQELTGRVKSALDFGVFIDLGIIDGFVPREEVSYDRGTHPSKILTVGSETQVKVLKVDRDSGKITLSRKRMETDPWESIEGRYPVGSEVEGEVVAIENYGAFLHVEEGVTGMVHASDMSWAPGNKKPSDFVEQGQKVRCQVLNLEKEKKRMSLGMKQLESNPWEEAAKKYPVKSKVNGTVTSMTSYGAFIRLDDYIEGMVHVSDLSWEKRINHPKEVLKAGEEVEAVVLKVDPSQQRISLGIKQVADSPFEAYLSKHPVNSVVTGKVTRFAPFGAFVELAPNLEGLIHISQIDEKRVELPEKALSVGEQVTCKIVKVEPSKQKISLSRKEALRQVERDTVRSYIRKEKEPSGGMSLGEALAEAQKEADKKNGEDE